MKSLFDAEAFSEIKNRIENLAEASPRQWGKMTHGQMLHHCQGPFNIMLEKVDYGMKPNWLAKVFFKKSLYSDKLWRKNLPTAKFLREKEHRNFNDEKAQLMRILDEFESQKDRTEWTPHPGFGYFTRDQWGRMQYKHLDHHLRQFGV
ncbi:uncharacterized protein DUF1569 [Ulvibacter sp. MAR_2010_11]|uniref:DUF1569 domain-containing protein n=1 Tax=Ulvibacter sp. MAR_2010_11 TaxID=1250229 RepID=UPI000C2B9819|nr:DUF1569 domain-containing protein [Ulvibacter sp. MAR_2010_11]PKA83452.1 uncharacterized protein DUF1569 [Ulvibacter sp. MAR_2010_11]